MKVGIVLDKSFIYASKEMNYLTANYHKMVNFFQNNELYSQYKIGKYNE